MSPKTSGYVRTDAIFNHPTSIATAQRLGLYLAIFTRPFVGGTHLHQHVCLFHNGLYSESQGVEPPIGGRPGSGSCWQTPRPDPAPEDAWILTFRLSYARYSTVSTSDSDLTPEPLLNILMTNLSSTCYFKEHILKGHHDIVNAILFSPHGHIVVSCGRFVVEHNKPI